MKSISIFVFVCINFIGFTQQITPTSSTVKKIDGLPNSKVGIKKDQQLGTGIVKNNTDEFSSNSYLSTIIYVQNGSELVGYTLSQSDYHFLKVKLDELLELNQQLLNSDLSPNRREQLEELRFITQSSYDQLLIQAVANAQ